MSSPTALAIDSTIKLANGSIPRLGLGVYQSRGKECADAVKAAIAAGYKHIDTAQGYHNEEQVAKAVSATSTPRSSLFITTKYMPSHSAPSTDEVYTVLRKSLSEVNGKSSTDPYIDLFLIHAPWGGEKGRTSNWAAMRRAQDEGWARDIGVSNFGVKHLETLPRPVPAVNQIELHPWCQQKDIVAYCQKKGIALMAYCPIVRADKDKFGDPVLVRICEKTGKGPAQVLIRWSLQKGYIPLPKSVSADRIKANADVYDFELDKEDMAALDGLDQGAAGAVSWNPTDSD